MTIMKRFLAARSRYVCKRLQPYHAFQVAYKNNVASQEPWSAASKGAHDIHDQSAGLSSIDRDIATLMKLRESIAQDTKTHAAMDSLIDCHRMGHTIYTTGIGKSGIVAQRLASTLSSISVPSHWVHGSEWAHGELGKLRPHDAIVLISHSGETKELQDLPDRFRACGCTTVSITRSATSTLSSASHHVIEAEAEDDAHVPVPSRSIIAQEAIVNYISAEFIAQLGHREAQLERNHPKGALGDYFSRQ